MSGTRPTRAIAIVVLALSLCACTVHTPTGAQHAGESPRSTPSTTSASVPTTRLGKHLATVVAGRVGGFPIEIPLDNGPEQYATGTATTDAHGVPIAYHVASGDILDYISERFGFYDPLDPGPYNSGIDYLGIVNQVRRGGYPWAIYAGDTLNLSAYRIDSIGDVNGIVRSDPPPTPMPPQG
jgi:hypothetical protein